VVVLPRTPEQRAELSGKGFIVPERAVDAQTLVARARLVISAGYYLCAAVILTLAGLALAVARRSLVRIIAAVVLWNVMIGVRGIGWVGPTILVVVTAATVVVLALHRAREPAIPTEEVALPAA
jgi:uncharacterized Tic20 family protein